MKWRIFGAALICLLVVPVFFLIRNCLELKKVNERIAILEQEIDRLEKVLVARGGTAFV